jgi:hypothetical protein
MFPGWTTPWYEDGSGWTASDEFSAREEGWNLLINDDQITPYLTPLKSVPVSTATSVMGQGIYSWKPLPQDGGNFMPKLLEKAMTGNKTAYKALYLMAYNDRRWRDYIPTVTALRSDYGNNDANDE